MSLLHSLALTVAITTAVCGALTSVIASWTLWSIKKRKSLHYLLKMTLIILALGLFQIVSGSLEINSIIFDGYSETKMHFMQIVIGECVEKLSIFVVMWLVTFKYWVTGS